MQQHQQERQAQRQRRPDTREPVVLASHRSAVASRCTAAPLQVQVGNNTPPNATIAAFLIARGASAILEFPIGGTYTTGLSYGWPSIMAADFGEPTADAIEVHPGVFRREWSKATIQIDCNTATPSFEFHTVAASTL